jgi:molybdopterin synthase sulfur carrier subunit
MNNIKVSYFASLREQAGCSSETLTTDARTLQDLFTELNDRTPFSLDPSFIKVAVDDVYVSWETLVTPGMHVVFIPPVSGG